jgi:hypothetical protein
MEWMGQEANPEDYIGHLVKLFQEIRRVLTDPGTVWIVLGDSYASQGLKELEGIFLGLKGITFLCRPHRML